MISFGFDTVRKKPALKAPLAFGAIFALFLPISATSPRSPRKNIKTAPQNEKIVKKSFEILKMPKMPSRAKDIKISEPKSVPSMVQKAFLKPPLLVFFKIKAVTGPGVMIKTITERI